LVGGSLGIAAVASAVILATALFLAYAIRLYPRWWMRFLVRGSMLGYALPGAIIGVAILVTFGIWDSLLRQFSQSPPATLLVSGTLGALVIAYFIRFLTVGFNPIEAGMKRINANMDEASRMLGRTPLGGFFRLHLPLLRLPILGALMVLFVDLMKELPLTLVLRPNNFETLATRTYGLMHGEERIAAGSVPALVLVLTGLATLVLLRRLIFQERLPG
jgi:iron(III) transport system permease protein